MEYDVVCVRFDKLADRMIKNTREYKATIINDMEAVLYAYSLLRDNGSVTVSRKMYGHGRDSFSVTVESTNSLSIEKKPDECDPGKHEWPEIDEVHERNKVYGMRCTKCGSWSSIPPRDLMTVENFEIKKGYQK